MISGPPIVLGVRDEAAFRELLDLFVRFVRLNPQLETDDPAIARAFRAYVDTWSGS